MCMQVWFVAQATNPLTNANNALPDLTSGNEPLAALRGMIYDIDIIQYIPIRSCKETHRCCADQRSDDLADTADPSHSSCTTQPDGSSPVHSSRSPACSLY